VNRRRIVYPAAVLVLAELVLLGDRLMNKDERKAPQATSEPYKPLDPNAPPATMSPAKKPAPPPGVPAPAARPTEPPIGRPPDVPPAPDAPAMSGTLQTDPTPTREDPKAVR
jgi:hypothetical protein